MIEQIPTNNGIVSGSGGYVTGKFGQAVNMTGATNSYVWSLKPPAFNQSMCFWVNFSNINFNANPNTAFYLSTGASSYYYWWYYSLNYELSSDKLVTIGSHTKNHFPMNQLSKKQIIDEVIGANEQIENKINKKVNHFAFPYGTINEVEKKEIEVLNNLGFKSIVTARNGNVYKKHLNYKYCLPRIMLTEKSKITDFGKIRKE